MNKFKIAHIREQGQDMIIIPLESSFGRKSEQEQSEIIASLQACAIGANLAGTVVVVWKDGNSHRFIAPNKWQPFFKSLPWNNIIRSLNKELTCG